MFSDFPLVSTILVLQLAGSGNLTSDYLSTRSKISVAITSLSFSGKSQAAAAGGGGGGGGEGEVWIFTTSAPPASLLCPLQLGCKVNLVTATIGGCHCPHHQWWPIQCITSVCRAMDAEVQVQAQVSDALHHHCTVRTARDAQKDVQATYYHINFQVELLQRVRDCRLVRRLRGVENR